MNRVARRFIGVLSLSLLALAFCVGLFGCSNKPIQLGTPLVSVSDKTVSWNEVEHATGYEVYLDGSIKETVTVTSYTVTETRAGNYEVKVRAVSADKKYSDSEFSEVVTVTVSAVRLSAPAVTVSGAIVSWSAVENSALYEVYADGEKLGEVSDGLSYDLSGLSAGDYTVTVKAISSDNTRYVDSEMSESVMCAVPKIAEGIYKISDPVKCEYYADGGESLDLDGLTAVIRYKNAPEEQITLTAENIVSDYSLSHVGRYELEFEYDGAYGVAVRIYVRERSKSDVDYIAVNNYLTYENGAWVVPETYDISDGSFTPVSAVDYKGNEIPLTDGKAASSALGFGETLLRVNDGSEDIYVCVTVACGIKTVEEFNSINDNPDGYYVLLNNLDFAGAGTKIGNAPLAVKWNATAPNKADEVSIDRTGAGTDTDGNGTSLGGVALGKAFTGTFDGNGYVISNFKSVKSGQGFSYRYKSTANAIFGWVGKSGTVKNLTLRSVDIRGDVYCALLAGYNEGVIENIAIEADCYVYNFFSAGAILCAYNYGDVRNVVSLISTGGTYYGTGEVGLTLISGGSDYTGETGVNCYVGDRSNLTRYLGDGWRYIDGYGTVYANSSYKLLLSYEAEWIIGVTSKIEIYVADEAAGNAYFHYWSGGSGAVSIYATEKRGNINVYTVGIAAGSTVTGKSLTVMGKFGTGSYCITLKPSVGDPYVIRIDDATDGSTTAVAGAGLNLANISINLVYTDGSTTPAIPTGYIESTYNSDNVGVTQKVTFYYENNGEFYYAVIAITPEETTEDYATALRAERKTSDKITVGENATLNVDDWFTFTLVMRSGEETVVTAADAGITAGEIVAGPNRVTFTYNDAAAGKVTTTAEIEVWYVITTATGWKKMNEWLGGYFVLGGDLDLSAENGDNSLVIGRVPLEADTEGYKIDVTGEGTEQEGVAFTGKFDGAGYKVSGFNTDYGRNTGATQAWQPTSYTLVPFAFIGEGGVVENFTLANATVRCGQHGSLLVGLNFGTVRDVVIENTCTLYVNYGGEATGAIAVINGGSVSNVTCHTTTFATSSETKNLTNVVYQNLTGGTVSDSSVKSGEGE